MAETGSQTPTVQSGVSEYLNGSDMLLNIGGKCVGHCTSHKVNYSSETKSHNVKPPENNASAASNLFSEESVTGLSYTVDFEGLQAEGESELSISALRAAWKAGKPIDVIGFKRGNKTTPSLKGKCVITSLTEDYPAQDDTTYSGSLKNFGAPEVLE